MSNGYLEKQQKEAEKYSFVIQKEANEAVKELNKHLILFATAILFFRYSFFKMRRLLKILLLINIF